MDKETTEVLQERYVVSDAIEFDEYRYRFAIAEEIAEVLMCALEESEEFR